MSDTIVKADTVIDIITRNDTVFVETTLYVVPKMSEGFENLVYIIGSLILCVLAYTLVYALRLKDDD